MDWHYLCRAGALREPIQRSPVDMMGVCSVLGTESVGLLSSTERERGVRETACSFRFSEVTIPSFVVLHALLSDERCSVCESAYDIGQVMMGVVLKRVANRERGMLWNRQPVRAWQTLGHYRLVRPRGSERQEGEAC